MNQDSLLLGEYGTGKKKKMGLIFTEQVVNGTGYYCYWENFVAGKCGYWDELLGRNLFEEEIPQSRQICWLRRAVRGISRCVGAKDLRQQIFVLARVYQLEMQVAVP